jgi:hypothetical protein
MQMQIVIIKSLLPQYKQPEFKKFNEVFQHRRSEV